MDCKLDKVWIGRGATAASMESSVGQRSHIVTRTNDSADDEMGIPYSLYRGHRHGV